VKTTGVDRETLAPSQEELVGKVHVANPRTVMVLVSSFAYTITTSATAGPTCTRRARRS
jgi:beta-glucosidase